MTFVKRHDYETQRAKPWHIKLSTGVGTLCGIYRSRTDAVRWSRYYVEVETIPDGQILCSVCEKIQEKEKKK